MRRHSAAIACAAALALAGACASSGRDGPSEVGAGLMTTTSVATATTPTTGSAAPTTARTATSRPSAPATDQQRPNGPAPTVATTVRGQSGGDGDPTRLGPPGAYARTLLRPAPATSIVVDVIVQRGASLRAGTIALVEDVLEETTEKEVAMVQRTVDAGGVDWDEGSINAFADRHAQQEATSTRATIRFLALRGGFTPDDNAIGVAVRGDVVALFVDKINGATTPLVDATTIEQAVAVHEIGHVLGLVDIAIDRDRDDPEHPFHSRNRGSVMFWAIETDLVGQILSGPPPRTFDRDDLADLAALRSGA